jgi:hypothetical protein
MPRDERRKFTPLASARVVPKPRAAPREQSAARERDITIAVLVPSAKVVSVA